MGLSKWFKLKEHAIIQACNIHLILHKIEEAKKLGCYDRSPPIHSVWDTLTGLGFHMKPLESYQ